MFYPHETSGKHFLGEDLHIEKNFLSKNVLRVKELLENLSKLVPRAPFWFSDMFYIVTIIEKSLRYNC